MAYLILNGREPHEEPEDQAYYEFNPGNELIFNEIVSLMSQRKTGEKKIIERKLAELCAASMRKNTSNPVFQVWRKNINRFLQQIKRITHSSYQTKTDLLSINPY